MPTPEQITNLCRLYWGSEEDRQIYWQICKGDKRLRRATQKIIKGEVDGFLTIFRFAFGDEAIKE